MEEEEEEEEKLSFLQMNDFSIWTKMTLVAAEAFVFLNDGMRERKRERERALMLIVKGDHSSQTQMEG
jgi:hypothetical protein